MRHCIIPVARLLASLGAMLPGAAIAQAGAVLIWPVDPAIEATQRATALWLENPGKAPIQLQVRVFGWQQSDAGDHYVAQNEVIGTPPMVRIEPGQRQLVRLTRTTPAPAGTEVAYRVIVDEIPLPTAVADRADAARIQFRMRYAIPLFSYGDGRSRPKPAGGASAGAPAQALGWRIVSEGGKRFLEMHNAGQTHVRLVNVSFEADKKPFAPGLLGYVLAGATMRWPLPEGAGNGVLRLSVNGEAVTMGAVSGD
ncbi:fimbrial biogenesis chaperone [Sphingomonas colocasiae]|uniref:Molecular chaperone n=1 Tax=Sphingomonas colocasiae TaxID=1848973 RepID=A0ABS7PMW6_9SPHN|nr:molecular chaperone [Sphingomonas colocasiae]MBY8821792.1 molecular chaperone [Sphingomonas colocasiae]